VPLFEAILLCIMEDLVYNTGIQLQHVIDSESATNGYIPEMDVFNDKTVQIKNLNFLWFINLKRGFR
jgi:hypothetical protein